MKAAAIPFLVLGFLGAPAHAAQDATGVERVLAGVAELPQAEQDAALRIYEQFKTPAADAWSLYDPACLTLEYITEAQREGRDFIGADVSAFTYSGAHSDCVLESGMRAYVQSQLGSFNFDMPCAERTFIKVFTERTSLSYQIRTRAALDNARNGCAGAPGATPGTAGPAAPRLPPPPDPDGVTLEDVLAVTDTLPGAEGQALLDFYQRIEMLAYLPVTAGCATFRWLQYARATGTPMNQGDLGRRQISEAIVPACYSEKRHREIVAAQAARVAEMMANKPDIECVVDAYFAHKHFPRAAPWTISVTDRRAAPIMTDAFASCTRSGGDS